VARSEVSILDIKNHYHRQKDIISMVDSIPLLSNNDSIPSLSDYDSMPEICTWFKIKLEIDVVVSYSTAQIQEVGDSLSNILFKEMIRIIGDLRLFGGDGRQPMLVLD